MECPELGPHTGQIAVEVSNTPWASDITSIKCWNGEKLRVAFVMDVVINKSLLYNTYARHSALEMKTPNEFYKLKSQHN
ncbi:hypothetical protein GCM10007049_35380 [Echinicola pacifica]|uniref:Uncharacterized protein n=1 Tax=Echinicola pacifica TaxID=346377 RepID=A0A918UWA2_9BACT|nr:hypothetical protein GCM10007049_35380 [Echinicola pacifica]